jgi:hypothetical protein
MEGPNMQVKTVTEFQADRFNLKNVTVEFVPEAPRLEHAFLSLQELESLRTQRPMISASKNGLEVICGASCETAAH